jgi:hypothetical protein
MDNPERNCITIMQHLNSSLVFSKVVVKQFGVVFLFGFRNYFVDSLFLNGQSRDNGSTGYTKYRTNKRQRKPKDQSSATIVSGLSIPD